MNEPNQWIQEMAGNLGSWCRLQTFKSHDIYSLELLNPLLNGAPIIPMTDSAMRPYCLAHLVNNVLVNSRQKIVEFGSGISTILLARLIQKNGLDASIVSVEHEKDWLDVVSKMLKRENLEGFVKLVHAPLSEYSDSIGGCQWYDKSVLDRELQDNDYDMVIVDGPPAYEEDKQEARFPALPYIFDRLAKNAVIYLDDANREGEKAIAQRWGQSYGLNFEIADGSLAWASIGSSFNVRPFFILLSNRALYYCRCRVGPWSRPQCHKLCGLE